jgi:hypothetical protein
MLLKQMPERKNDVKDAAWIASLLMKGMLKDSFVLQKIIRVLRAYETRNLSLYYQQKIRLKKLNYHQQQMELLQATTR